MTSTNRHFRLQNLESYNRIVSIPIVHSGWNFAEHIYEKIKHTNNLLLWTFDQAEESLKTIAVSSAPVVELFLEKPLTSVDRLICKSLDIVENQVPAINLPPQMIFSNTKEYISDVSTKLVKPVLKRADSVKQMGNSVLVSRYTEYAADKLDDALDIADAYIEKYLPAEKYDDQTATDGTMVEDIPGKKAIHTIQHVDRFSRKLQRRLTKRTLERAKILKEQSTEAIHVLIYVAEMIATDPILALQKGKELWAELSKDEPENQARPNNVEELFVMVVRESSRRFVHLVNYTSGLLSQVPSFAVHHFHDATISALRAADLVIKSIHLEGFETFVINVFKGQLVIFTHILKEINSYLSKTLDNINENLNETDKVIRSLAVPKIEVNSKATNDGVKMGNHFNPHKLKSHGHENSHHHSNGNHSPPHKGND